MRKKTPPDPSLAALKTARQSGKYMVAIWHVEDGNIHLYRTTQAFPVSDFDASLNMLEGDLRKEVQGDSSPPSK